MEESKSIKYTCVYEHEGVQFVFAWPRFDAPLDAANYGFKTIIEATVFGFNFTGDTAEIVDGHIEGRWATIESQGKMFSVVIVSEEASDE